MLRFLSAVFVSAFLVVAQGCAALPGGHEMASDIKGFQLPAEPHEGKALVYVVRPSLLGKLINFNVFLDGQTPDTEMGYTQGAEYIYFEVSPGEHVIQSKAENWAEIAISAKAGDIIFVKQDVRRGTVMAMNTLHLIDQTEGRYHVKHTSVGAINQGR